MTTRSIPILKPRPDEGVAVLESEIAATTNVLVESLDRVVQSTRCWQAGPVALARELGLDKVLTSRVLKAMRAQDPISAAHAMPGPEPLRRFVRAAARHGVPAEVTGRANAAIDTFATMIRDRLGDRSQLDAVLSAWAPEARREFELRRKQAVFRAMAQLKGIQAGVLMATAIIHPSASAAHNDVVWVNGTLGVHRVRPGVTAKLTTRRMTPTGAARLPETLDGAPISDVSHLLLPEFCSEPLPDLDVRRNGDVMSYVLGGGSFGSETSSDVVFAEVSRADLPRYVAKGTNRLSYFFAEVSPPAEVLQFDVLVHRDLYPGQDPTLRLYDTALEGVANANDPARDLDRLDILETIEPLGDGLARSRSRDVSRYPELLRRVMESMRWNAAEFRGFRCRVTYPLYGSQVMMCFRAMEEA